MDTLDHVISKERMLSSPANYKAWKTTVQNVFEKEDLWDCLEPYKDLEIEDGGGSIDDRAGTATIANVAHGARAATGAKVAPAVPAAPTRQELERIRRRKTRALGILKLTLTEGVHDFIAHHTDPREAWLELQ